MKLKGRNLKPKSANLEFFFNSWTEIKRKETIDFLAFINIKKSPLVGANFFLTIKLNFLYIRFKDFALHMMLLQIGFTILLLVCMVMISKGKPIELHDMV